MFLDDSDKHLLLEIKEKSSSALGTALREEEVKVIAEICRDIDSLILCKDVGIYESHKDAAKSHIFELAMILEVSTNTYIRNTILPLIDKLTDDLLDR